MSTEKIYPKGLRVFPKHQNAPDFVIAEVIVTPNELFAWLKENQSLLKDYKGEKQLRLQMLNGNKGMYFVVNTFEPSESKPEAKRVVNDISSSNLPF